MTSTLLSLHTAVTLATKAGDPQGIIIAHNALRDYASTLKPYGTGSPKELAVVADVLGYKAGCSTDYILSMFHDPNPLMRLRNVNRKNGRTIKERPRATWGDLATTFSARMGWRGK